jgi:glycosyltransferase involved in cell wall biosynthesis
MEGGKDYISEKGWDKARHWPVRLDKVTNINQGVDLETFDADRARPFHDDDLEEAGTFKVVYVGSIRHANNLSVILDAAELLHRKNEARVKILIYGDGDKRTELEESCRERGLTNVKFKGRISPADAPALLSRSDLNLFHFAPTSLMKYGLSPNKLFIYFASAKPILSTVRPQYDLVERYRAGISVDSTANSIADAIMTIADAEPEQYAMYCANARKAAVDYDYKKLAQKLIELIPPVK